MNPIIIKGKIWTHEGFANWMSFSKANFIEEVGFSSEHPSEKVLSCATVIQLPPDRYVIPGLIDAHIHVAMSTLTEQISLVPCESLDQLESCLKDADTLEKKWILAHGWNDGIISDKPLDRFCLDRVSTTKPVIAYRNCFHLCVVNTFTLFLFGLIDCSELKQQHSNNWNEDCMQQVREYFRNELEKARSGQSQMVDIDSEGNPTGILCETALFQVKKFISNHLSDELKEEFLERGLTTCLSRGLTSVQSNDFFGSWQVYRSLVSKKKVPIRVYMTLPYDEILNPQDTEDDTIPLPDDQIGLVSCHRVKLFADGSLGAKTAALRAPYHDFKCRHSHGILIHSEEELTRKIRHANELGYRHEIHVIGDKAVETVLKSLDNAGVTGENRPILTHCQILGKDLITKMHEMNVIANIQPSFVTTDGEWVVTRLGQNEERLKYSYAWKTLLLEGVHVAGGSDAPVESCDPFEGMHAAIYRTYGTVTEKRSDMKVLFPHERLTFKEAMDIYTKGGAYAAGEEDRIGQIKPGFYADFVVINQPIWESCAKTDKDVDKTWDLLKDVHVSQVWVNGELVFKT